MKRIILILIMVVAQQCLYAQQNFIPGYVITKQGTV